MIDDGSKVAHAIRRSSALYMAIITVPEGTPDEALFRKADSYAKWIRGSAGKAEEEDYLGMNPWEEE